MKRLLSELGPKRLTKYYDYDAACDDIEQINTLLRRPLFKVVAEDGIKVYRADVIYTYNKCYSHLASDTKIQSKIKAESVKIIRRYMNYLYEYCTSIYGEPFTEGGIATWYRMYR